MNRNVIFGLLLLGHALTCSANEPPAKQQLAVVVARDAPPKLSGHSILLKRTQLRGRPALLVSGGSPEADS